MRSIDSDIVILGGGIAALWTANVLKGAGYSVLVLSNSNFGKGQTLASQGVIHGGLKYALTGKRTDSSEALAAMPGRWQKCLAGEGEIDLRKVAVLSRTQILWSLPQVVSKVVAFFGSQALENRARPLRRPDFPAPFDDPSYRGKVFELGEIVIDPVSLIEVLAANLTDVAGLISWPEQAELISSHGELEQIRLRGRAGADLAIRARQWIFAAGAGNEELLSRIGRPRPVMQRRPLHQVVIRSGRLPPLYSVCIGNSAKPPVVITTHWDSDGKQLWYVGGDLAETGIGRTQSEQIACARRKFDELMPWVDFTDAQWSAFQVDRAEPDTGTGDRPAGLSWTWRVRSRPCGRSSLLWRLTWETGFSRT